MEPNVLLTGANTIKKTDLTVQVFGYDNYENDYKYGEVLWRLCLNLKV